MSNPKVKVTIADQMSVPASTLALVNNGAQNAFIGEEIVGVVDSTDVGGGEYEIGPDLVRGMRGSPVGAHAAGETFAAAPTVAAATKIQVDPQYVGKPVWVRVLTQGQDLDDSPEKTCTISQPKSPYVTHLPKWTTDTFTGDGGTTAFTLAHTQVSGSVSVTVGGSTLDPSAYSVAGTTLTITTPPASGTAVSVRYQY